jgi:hypothetical protein
VGNGEPSLGGLAEVNPNLIESLALRVTTWKCWDGGGVATGLGFWTDQRGEDNSNIDGNGWGRRSNVTHSRFPPLLLIYRRAGTRSRAIV